MSSESVGGEAQAGQAEAALGFVARFMLAFVLPWRLLFDARFAAEVQRIAEGRPALPPKTEAPRAEGKDEPKAEAAKAGAKASTHNGADGAALHVLSLLQRDGRLIDFLLEDVSAFSDSEVGAAARTVHEGCKKTLQQYFELTTIRDEEEGAQVTLQAGFDPHRVRLVGNVTGAPPYKGTLAHPGWAVKAVKLPERMTDTDPNVLAPAEVEL